MKQKSSDISKNNVWKEEGEEKMKFVSNKSEEIVAVLGKANAITLLNNSINSRGFCILSDKAFYFVGNVYQKKYIGSFKTNIQHRVPVTEMKGIKVGTLHRYEMFIFGIISIITFINEVKIFITMLYADYNWFVYIDEDTIPFIMISSLLASAVTLIMSVYYIFQAILVKRTTVCIELNGLTIHFLVCELGKQEIKDFYREVSKMQNERISEVQNDAIQKQMPDQPDKVKKLMNLSHLYEQGLLQREEFEKLKNEIINEP